MDLFARFLKRAKVAFACWFSLSLAALLRGSSFVDLGSSYKRAFLCVASVWLTRGTGVVLLAVSLTGSSISRLLAWSC